MAAIGGAAALLARHIVASRIVTYDDLGPEAIRELTIEAFPVIVVNDCHGIQVVLATPEPDRTAAFCRVLFHTIAWNNPIVPLPSC